MVGAFLWSFCLRHRLNQFHHRSKIIENLAVVNYDTNNLYLAPYDWRLSYWNLEERDGYFSRLKSTIEEFRCGHLRRLYIAFFTLSA